MSQKLSRLFTDLSLLAFTPIMVLLEPAHAQVEAGKGWIEGVVVNAKNDPAGSYCGGPGICSPARVTIRSTDGKGVFTDTDSHKGGFYTFRDLKPGVYELFIDKTVYSYPNDDQTYRPIHIFGLVVEASKRTLLNITVHEGTGMEIGRASCRERV